MSDLLKRVCDGANCTAIQSEDSHGWPRVYELDNDGGVLLSSKELKKFGLELPIDVVRDFEVVGIKDKEGDITHRELRFTIESSAKNAARLVEEYCARLSRHPGLGKVSYTKQAGSEEDEDDSQMTLLGAVAATAE